MKKLLIFSSIISIMMLSSCGFLLSPIGEELIVDGAEELVKIEQELVHSSSNIIENLKQPEKEVVNEKIIEDSPQETK